MYISRNIKFDVSELRGVPLRISIGESEVENNILTIVRRDSGENIKLSVPDIDKIRNILDIMQSNMLEKANNTLQSHIKFAKSKDEIDEIIKDNLVQFDFCCRESCEEHIKEKYGIKSLCIREGFNYNERTNKCIICDEPADNICLFGKSF